MADDKSRPQVDTSFNRRQFGFMEDLDPNAAPVDTYVRPASPAPSSLHGLATSLSNFSQDLSGFMKSRDAKQNERDESLGAAAALKSNGEGYAEAVRDGKIATYNSPVFQQAYKQSQGAIMGKRLAAGAVDAYQQWPQRNSQDPADFDKFLGGYIKQNLNTDDPDVLAGALPYVTSTSDALYNANEKERSDSLYDSSIKSHIASSSMSIDNASDVSLTRGSEINYDDLWTQIMNDRTTALASGVRGEDYDKQMLDMVHSKALEYMDPGMLGMLKNKVPGKDYSYDDMDGSKATQDTLTTMESRQASVERLKADEERAANGKELDQITGSVLANLAKNPDAAIDPKVIARAVQLGDGAFAVHVKEWAKTMAGATPTPEDPNFVAALQAQIISGAPLSALTDEIGVDINDPQTVSSLYSLYNTVHSEASQSVMENEIVKRSLGYLHQEFPAKDEDGQMIPGSFTPDGIQAQTDYLTSMAMWAKAHPNASLGDINAQATKVLKDMQSTIKNLDDLREQNKYVRPQAITEDMGAGAGAAPPNLTPDAAQQAVTDRQKVDGKAANARAADPWQQDKPPTLGQLPQEQQDKINARAAGLGVTPDEIIKRLYASFHTGQ